MRPQIRTAEVGIYPLLVIGGEFRNDIDSGLSDVAHIFGSPSVVSLARCDVAGLDFSKKIPYICRNGQRETCFVVMFQKVVYGYI